MADLKLYGTGRRKRSVARVFLKTGKGEITINGKNFKDYLCRDSLATIVKQPLVLLELEKSYDITINVNGGGLTGQAGAIRLGIARCIQLINPDNRLSLKQAGMLTRDSRAVERKKYGQPGARKKFQFSKR